MTCAWAWRTAAAAAAACGLPGYLGQRILLGFGVGYGGLGLVELLLKSARVEDRQQITLLDHRAFLDIHAGNGALGLEHQVGIPGGFDLAGAADTEVDFGGWRGG